MHSHDRTLIGRLGFADPDKKDWLHDWACQYLALPENSLKVARMVFPAGVLLLDKHKPRFEQMITKGYGIYATTIEFLDLTFEVWSLDPVDGERYRRCDVAVEVKITPLPAGDVIRQLNLYRAYKDASFALASHFDWDSHDTAMLEEAGIMPVRLGVNFDRWCRQRRDFDFDNSQDEI